MTMPAAQAQDWTMGGQDLNNSRSQPITSINAGNAKLLQLKHHFNAQGVISATPAVADGVVYFPDSAGYFYALNASDLSVKWTATLATWTGIAGDSARNDPAIVGNVLILGNQAGFSAKWNGTAWRLPPVPRRDANQVRASWR